MIEGKAVLRLRGELDLQAGQREIGGDLVLRAPTEPVRRVLDIVGLSETLTMAEAAAPALALDDPDHSDAASSSSREAIAALDDAGLLD